MVGEIGLALGSLLVWEGRRCIFGVWWPGGVVVALVYCILCGGGTTAVLRGEESTGPTGREASLRELLSGL